MLGVSPDMVCEWLVDSAVFFDVDDPRLEVVPYITCDVADALVVHETVADVVVMLVAVTFEIVVLLPPPLAAVRRSV